MATVTISSKLLEDAARRNNFAIPANQLIFFGIRGAVPETATAQNFAREHAMNFAPIDHRVMRCTIGQWNCMAGTVALFPGSTVPSAASVEAARKAGGAGANMLLPGRYEHEKGIHKSG